MLRMVEFIPDLFDRAFDPLWAALGIELTFKGD